MKDDFAKPNGWDKVEVGKIKKDGGAEKVNIRYETTADRDFLWDQKITFQPIYNDILR